MTVTVGIRAMLGLFWCMHLGWTNYIFEDLKERENYFSEKL